MRGERENGGLVGILDGDSWGACVGAPGSRFDDGSRPAAKTRAVVREDGGVRMGVKGSVGGGGEDVGT